MLHERTHVLAHGRAQSRSVYQEQLTYVNVATFEVIDVDPCFVLTNTHL